MEIIDSILTWNFDYYIFLHIYSWIKLKIWPFKNFHQNPTVTSPVASFIAMLCKIFNKILWFFFKAYVCYFLSNFCFFNQMIAFKNYEKCFLFHLKRFVRSWDFQTFVIFPFLDKLSRFKRANGSGIIYDVIDWLV